MTSTLVFFAVLAFSAGLINTAFGVGGGVLLISCLPGRVAPTAVVPLHGLAILVNNICRSLLDWRCIRWRIVTHFMAGAALGALAALPLLHRLPVERVPLLLGVGILVLTWLPRWSLGTMLPAPFFCCGLLQTFLSMFVGATGPLVMLFFLNQGFSRDELIAHNAVVNVGADIIKMAGFLYLGFPYADFLPQIAVLAGGMTSGAFAGKLLRGRVSPRFFFVAIKLIISGLAIRMIVA